MSKAVKMCRMLLCGILLPCLFQAAAAAEPVDGRELSRWVPSFSLISGLAAQKIEGHINTTDVLGPQDTDPSGANPAQPLLPGAPVTERTRMMTPFVGVALEVMTPAWSSLPGKPRAFAHGDVGYAFGPDYNVPMVGDPGVFRASPRITPITEGTILGQGGRMTVSVAPLWLMAGAGVAFTLDAWERALRIKVSAEYVREEVEIRGLVRRAVALSNSSPTLAGFRPVTLTAAENVIYDGIGPGLEFEVDTARTGPFVLALYLGVKAWRYLDNEKVLLSDTNVWDESATWTFLKNDWGFGGTLGLRFRWVPE